VLLAAVEDAVEPDADGGMSAGAGAGAGAAFVW
jgi:hypothetical protein